MKQDVQLITPTDGDDINGILSDFRWYTAAGEQLVLEYSFFDADSDFLVGTGYGYDPDDSDYDLPFREGFRAFTEAEREMVHQVMADLENWINVDFVEVVDSANSELRFGFTDLDLENADGLAFLPAAKFFPFDIDTEERHEAGEVQGDIWIDIAANSLELNEVILHEIGHALGLHHSFEDGFDVLKDVAPAILDGELDYIGNTVMSNQPAPSTVADSELIFSSIASTFMLLDVEALQRLYGEASPDQTDDVYFVRQYLEAARNVELLGYAEYESHDYINGYIAINDDGGNNALIIDVDADIEVDISQGGWNYTAGGILTTEYDDPSLYFSENTVWSDVYTARGDDLVVGNDSNNVIQTRSGKDVVYGGGGDDAVSLGSHDDHYVYTAGNDTVSGGLGFDTIEFGDLEYAHFKFYVQGESVVVTEIVAGTTLDLQSVERLIFGDRQFSLSNFQADIRIANSSFILDDEVAPYLSDIGEEGDLVSASDAQLYRLYFGGLARAPDQAGFDFWSEKITEGSYTFPEVAARFIDSPEFFNLADSNNSGELSDEEFLDHMYLNVLGRYPDTHGYHWWLDQLDEEGLPQEQAFSDMVQSDEFVLLTAATVNEFLFV